MTQKVRSRTAIRFLLFALILALASTASAEWKEKVLYSFQGGTDGAYPAGGVVFDKQGNLYGATQYGGGTNCSPMAACGTVYQLAPPAKQGEPWSESLLHVFQGKQHNDGEFPSGGVIADALGNIYGTASYGGTGDCVLLGVKGGCGTVFELSPPQTKGGKWTYTILYSFKGGKDGYLPFGDLVLDAVGNLYGATYFGGGKGTTCDSGYYQYCGTVFELSRPKTTRGKWTEKVLHSFAAGTDGANPNGGLVLNKKGAVYGTTSAGGNQGCKTTSAHGCGTAFELKPPTKTGGAWMETLLHRFQGNRDGNNPAAGLAFDRNGGLYGTTLTGGPGGGGGTVFRLTPPSKKSGVWKKAILHGFDGVGGGLDAESPVVFDSNGNLYGTTLDSGGTYYGTVFRLTPPQQDGDNWNFSMLYGFEAPPDGGQPAAGLVFDKSGNLYSTTTEGGSGNGCSFHGCGTVFEVSPAE
ncbi:MAG TPA: choice-of-anchor tandem repeat GloVer-containing protein [Terriglobales bacterium]|nr:choice-of-anchor tandem repeat GloVer-containing protein [Terriglobales bacterium]